MNKPKHSQTDTLTGLLTRKSFQEKYTSLLDKAKEKQFPLSLALIDIDKFLTINETYGHTPGDKVLEAIALIIKEKTDNTILTARYGGDEFALLFPNTEREQAFLTLEAIRTAIYEQKIIIDEKTSLKGICVSGGLASFPIDGRSESELLRKADQALYRVKLTGRNKIRLAYEERMVPKTSHFTQTQLERLSKLAEEFGTGEAELLREALDTLLTKYGVNDIET